MKVDVVLQRNMWWYSSEPRAALGRTHLEGVSTEWWDHRMVGNFREQTCEIQTSVSILAFRPILAWICLAGATWPGRCRSIAFFGVRGSSPSTTSPSHSPSSTCAELVSGQRGGYALVCPGYNLTEFGRSSEVSWRLGHGIGRPRMTERDA